MSEWEEADPFESLQPLLVIFPLVFLVFEDLVGLNEGVCLVCLVRDFEVALLGHLGTLVLEQILLIFPLCEFLVELTVFLLVNLVNDLAKEVVVV